MSHLPGSYALHACITSLAGPVFCMSVSEDGKLAAGGTGGTTLWRIPDSEPIQNPSAAGTRGATTALAWIRRDDDPDDILVYGTQSGVLVVWKEVKQAEPGKHMTFEELLCVELASPSEITGISFEATANQLAVCNRNSVIQLFAVNSRMALSNIFSVVVENHIPKAIAFERAGHSHTILSCGLYDGKIHTLRCDTGQIEKTVETGSMIGNAQLDVQRNILCLDDPSHGAALYKADIRARVRSYKVPIKKAMRPRQVAFAEDCSKIIIGSDHGRIYVFDRRRATIVQELSATSGGIWMQTVTAAEVMGVPFIIGAKSQEDGREGEIYLWKKNAKTHLVAELGQVQRPWRSWLLHFILVVTSVAFVCQNLGVIRLLRSLISNVDDGELDDRNIIYL